MTTPALQMPADDAAWEGWLRERVTTGLRDAADNIAALKQAPLADPAILDLWNDIGISLADNLAVTALLAQVHPDPAVTGAAEELEAETRRFHTGLMLDTEVYAALSSLEPDPADADATRVLSEALRDFRRAGVDRDDETRARLAALDERLTDLGQAFARNIRDGRRTTRVPEAALDGLPDDYVAEHPADADGTVEISTEYPDTHPFLTFSTDHDARRAVASTFFNLAWPENDEVLRDLLRTRDEKARLLGYDGWPDYDAEVKMIGSGEAIGEFVDRIAAAARATGERETAELADVLGEPVDIGNWRFAMESVQRDRFRLDSQAARPYFAFDKVRQGLLDVTGRLFGLVFEPVDVPAWHPDVTSYDVRLDGELLGRIHLDLHPRERKYNHAAMFDLVSGIRGRQLPEGVLVCNFPRGLMTHSEVVTLFHEFGHLLHQILAGRHIWQRFSGIATEWDFVEAPSQMLEEWAWDHEVLATFATDDAGEPIPADLVERMRAADEYGKGFLVSTQMFYAALSYRLHRELPDDLTARMLELYADYHLANPLPDTHFFAGFGHLEGYSSAYYTYMWSKTIAKDLFTAFSGTDLFAPEVATRYRDLVLARGGSRPAAELVEEFLGRPYDDAAFSDWLAS